MNSSTFYLMSMLCKLSVGKYMIIVKTFMDENIKNMIKLIIKNKNKTLYKV